MKPRDRLPHPRRPMRTIEASGSQARWTRCVVEVGGNRARGLSERGNNATLVRCAIISESLVGACLVSWSAPSEEDSCEEKPAALKEYRTVVCHDMHRRPVANVRGRR